MDSVVVLPFCSNAVKSTPAGSRIFVFMVQRYVEKNTTPGTYHVRLGNSHLNDAPKYRAFWAFGAQVWRHKKKIVPDYKRCTIKLLLQKYHSIPIDYAACAIINSCSVNVRDCPCSSVAIYRDDSSVVVRVAPLQYILIVRVAPLQYILIVRVAPLQWRVRCYLWLKAADAHGRTRMMLPVCSVICSFSYHELENWICLGRKEFEGIGESAASCFLGAFPVFLPPAATHSLI